MYQLAIKIDKNDNYIEVEKLSNNNKEILFGRMKQAKPDLYDLLKSDGVKEIVKLFNANLRLRKKVK